MLRSSFILIALFVFAGCSYNIPMRKVELEPFFHDHSSKVWVIDYISDGEEDLTVDNPNFRDVLIFYKSGKTLIQPLNSLGNRQGIAGQFSTDSDNDLLIIEQDSSYWEFKITSHSINRVSLKPTNTSDFKYDIEIIPLPELY